MMGVHQLLDTVYYKEMLNPSNLKSLSLVKIKLLGFKFSLVKPSEWCTITLTLARGWCGRCKKTVCQRKKGGWKKKHAQHAPGGQGSKPALPLARRGSPTAHHGSCLDK